jgi:DNA-binding response OmpR family regulator
MSRAKILVAEDDRAIRQGLLDALESEHYDTVPAANGKEALAAAKQQKFDLILLDIMMPEISGYDVCRQIRAGDMVTPIIMLTAKGEEIDKVVGLELGADDYVTKPFGLRELLARVAAVLRRARVKAQGKAGDGLPDVYDFGPAQVNRKTYTITLRGKAQELTARELKLLDHFRRNPDVVLSRDDLLNSVWGVEYYGTTRTLDQHVAQLRKKVEIKPDEPQAILTVHGVGYRFHASPAAAAAGENRPPTRRRG